MTLSVLVATVGIKEAQAEQDCIKIKARMLSADKDLSDAKADTYMKATDEYLHYRTVKALGLSLIEIIRMVKKRLEVLGREWETSPRI